MDDANFAPSFPRGGVKKVKGAKSILRPFSGKMGAKYILRLGAGRRAQGAFYPRPEKTAPPIIAE